MRTGGARAMCSGGTRAMRTGGTRLKFTGGTRAKLTGVTPVYWWDPCVLVGLVYTGGACYIQHRR